MTTPILLPPLPPIREWRITHAELRARDLEVARLVLEAAIGVCGHLAQADAVLHLLRKLEVKHRE